MPKTPLSLFLEPVEAKWMVVNYAKGSIHFGILRNLLELLIEPRPDNFEKRKFHTSNHLIVSLPGDIQPSARYSTWRFVWIPPAKMLVLQKMIERMWKYELTTTWLVREGRLNADTGKENEQIEMIFDFVEKYDLSDDEFTTARAQKIIQRSRNSVTL